MNGRNQRSIFLVALIAAAVLFGIFVGGSSRLTPPSAAAKSAAAGSTARASMAAPSFADIAEETLTSVVSITSTEIVKGGRWQFPFGEQDPFEFFFGPQPRRRPQEHKQQAAGSGFFVSEDGYILTNNHVVADATKIQVKLRDREVFQARLVGKDAATDIALIKIEAKQKIRPLHLGDSDKLRVGDWVMAVGNPLNFEGTVTVGVVSAKGRGGLTDDPNTASFEDFIQTDAAINFGNSGGPLINVAGEVVGINTAMVQPAQNIGFAVAINTAKSILPQLKQQGRVVRGLLGIRIRSVDQDVKEAFHLPSMNGAFVESVEPKQPAERAGIQPGDTIIQVDDLAVKDAKDLIGHVSSTPPGQKIRIRLLRNGKAISTTATLAKRESESQKDTEPAREKEGTHRKLGISVTDLTPQLRQQLNIGPAVTGVVVEDVKEVSPAAEQGLAEGDVITEVNGAKVVSTRQFWSETERVQRGEYIRLYVRRFRPQELSRFVVIRRDW